MDFAAQPGQIFVVATLLPLASFLVLLLAGALRQATRSSPQGTLGESIYKALGADQPQRWPALVATGAIGLSCVLCVIGFVIFLSEHHHNEVRLKELAEEHHKQDDKVDGLETAKAEAEQELDEAKNPEDKAKAQRRIDAAQAELDAVAGKIKEIEDEEKAVEKRWAGHIDWVRLNSSAVPDPDRGTILQLGFKIDHLSGVMFVMVTFIATLIHVFSMGYMAEELDKIVADHHVHAEDGGHFHRRGRFGRFFLFLSLFCFSMLNLVLADNLFQIFLSWELVGICSYLLIGFYYERQSAANASNKAFITNRVGDAGFIIGLLIIWTYVGTFNFDSLFKQIRTPMTDAHGKVIDNGGKFLRGNEDAAERKGKETRLVLDEKGESVVLWAREPGHLHAPGKKIKVSDEPEKHQNGHMPYWMLVVAGLGVFLGCVGKSAQFPLQVWLPDAMEGPTPVSALIHAATMVAAGVYLVGRCYPLFTPEARLVIAYTGAITLFVAASIALVMTDIKKVLAYSTVSQLGYMMLALGVGGWVAGLFHLVTHAFFKALLFLGSGSVIYGCHHEQEMTKMGGLYPKMKITALTMLMGVLAIAGIPGFSGWYSKDAVLASAIGFVKVHPEHALLFILPLVTAGITTFYMFRMWLMTFTGKPRDHHVYEHARESPPLMTVPLIILAFFSVTVAWGWPFFSSHFPFLDAETSALEHQIHHAQPLSVQADLGTLAGHSPHTEEVWGGPAQVAEKTERYWGMQLHHLAGNLALLVVAIGMVFAFAVYYYGQLDPAEAKEQFPGVHRFLMHKWYFDELYSALIVRPALVIAHWCRIADNKGIDRALDAGAEATVWVSKKDGKFDNNIIDGLVNLTATVAYGIGGRLRNVQTGSLRSYVLFLVLAAVGIYVLLASAQ